MSRHDDPFAGTTSESKSADDAARAETSSSSLVTCN